MMPPPRQIASRFPVVRRKGLQAKRVAGHALPHTDDRPQTQIHSTALDAGAWLCSFVHRGGAVVLGREWCQTGFGHAALGSGECRRFVFDFLPDRLGGFSHLAKRLR